MLSKILLGILIFFLSLFIAGFGYQTIQTKTDLKQSPPPGQLVSVDGINLHIDCRGQGSPLVVMESGLGNSSIAWYQTLDKIAGTTRVCAYDRPGLGWSDPIEKEVASSDVALRLEALLTQAGESGPKIMVGWSAGGVYIRNFQRQFPQDVVGMVFVDSSHEQQGDRLPSFGDNEGNPLLQTCALLQPFGLVRILGIVDDQVQQAELPQNISNLLIATSNKSHFCQTIQRESASFEADIHEQSPPHTFGDLPIVVLTQGKQLSDDELQTVGMTKAEFAEMRATWNVLQQELAALSSRGEHIIAIDSGHAIASDQPDLVVEAVERIVGIQR